MRRNCGAPRVSADAAGSGGALGSELAPAAGSASATCEPRELAAPTDETRGAGPQMRTIETRRAHASAHAASEGSAAAQAETVLGAKLGQACDAAGTAIRPQTARKDAP